MDAVSVSVSFTALNSASVSVPALNFDADAVSFSAFAPFSASVFIAELSALLLLSVLSVFSLLSALYALSAPEFSLSAPVLSFCPP